MKWWILMAVERERAGESCSTFLKRRAICSTLKTRAHNQFYVEQIALRYVLCIDKVHENAA
jgi:hypothetical protein